MSQRRTPSGTQRACETPKPEDRVRHIKKMMVEGSWREGVSDHELGDLWGIDASTVRHSSAEASRALRSAIEDEGLAARLVSILLNNVEEARNAKRFEAVARSVEVAAKILGLDDPKASKGPEPEREITINVMPTPHAAGRLTGG